MCMLVVVLRCRFFKWMLSSRSPVHTHACKDVGLIIIWCQLHALLARDAAWSKFSLLDLLKKPMNTPRYHTKKGAADGPRTVRSFLQRFCRLHYQNFAANSSKYPASCPTSGLLAWASCPTSAYKKWRSFLSCWEISFLLPSCFCCPT